MVWTQRVRDALVRTYATTTKIPKHFAYQDKRKGFSERKTFLFNKYQRMMRENELVVLFHAENLNVKLLSEIRRQVSHIKVPDADLARLEALNHGAPWTWPASAFTMARTGLLRPVCRRDTAESIQALEPYLHGQMAMLTCPVLSPEYVGKVLRAIERPVTAAANDVDPKSEKKAPLLRPLVAVAERARVIDAKSLPAFTQLPNLATLRAQLVGLLSSPGTQLAGVLSQAGGGELAATLEARRRDLEA
ncbi:50S ribosomal protein L10 [Malassezia restricta CBS 7877]|uniref:50S ribosomal protein L10 n=1 Tax=Malassezia restricta (strain ATCC 96810 / NBRC 103918 / CBS 7877) TaxID=425264 RepID=A0A3G2S6S7_MALR7|nr:50S ribosomal protein L10 [Malassezia restricta CBS 7877]